MPPVRSLRAILGLGLVAALAAGAAAPQATAADPGVWRHGLSLMGEPKYPPDFKRFDYVNPDAPKAGTARLARQGAFDNFNPVVAGVKGQIEGGVGLVYEQLTEQSLDEVSTAYGLLAEAMRHPPDYSSVTYRLRAEARWHDGKPVTPEDVVFSFEVYKANSPNAAFYYQHVTKAEKTGEREVTFTFDQAGNRELPQIVGQLTILPKHWWEGTGPDGRKRDIRQTTLEPPLGSGAYRVKAFDAQRSVVYERVKDYWGEKVPVQVGTNNFDEIRFEYYRDSTVLVEAFKGDQYDFRVENSAKNWATAYDFPAVKDGRVVREEFADRAIGRMQAFAFNLRRPKFQDPRVRRAFNFAFDFEEMNKQIFFGAYQRIDSFFEGTELASSGLPDGKEKEILESVRDKVPPAVFTTAYTNPVAGNAIAVRENLREADRLLKEAGWEIKNGRRVNAKTGEHLTVEFLGFDPTTERYVLFYKPSLERLGIGVSLRVVDPSQYENRMREFDFDLTTELWPQSLSPGNEQREFWGSKAASLPGSRNVLGLRDPGVDALIDRIIFAKDREELVAATRALDRVLLAHDLVVPQWTYNMTRTVRWNRFGRPDPLPRYSSSGFPTIWWWDAEKARQTGAPR